MKAMFKNELVSAAAKQLASDYCCNAEDFACKNNTVTLAGITEGRRIFRAEPDFFKVGTMGNGAVITAAGEMLYFANELAENTAVRKFLSLPKSVKSMNSLLNTTRLLLSTAFSTCRLFRMNMFRTTILS